MSDWWMSLVLLSWHRPMNTLAKFSTPLRLPNRAWSILQNRFSFLKTGTLSSHNNNKIIDILHAGYFLLVKVTSNTADV
jgi:hypothetical protein